MNECDFSDLLGRTLVRVEGKVGDDDMRLICSDGTTYRLWHDQDCCETVNIEDICGDVADLIGNPLTVAEEVIHAGENPPGVPLPEGYQDSFTWTFYRLATERGAVTIRWYGSSNGYYSEGVSVERIGPTDGK